MPFTSQAQRAACFAQYRRDIQAGIKPRWNCYSYGKDKKTRTRKNGRLGRIRRGPRGGRYRMVRGRKVYI